MKQIPEKIAGIGGLSHSICTVNVRTHWVNAAISPAFA
jgi:hypothetical protein